MSDWTKTNFEKLEDRSPAGAATQWRFAREALRSRELGVSRFTYEPGARMPFGDDGMDVICVGSRPPEGGDDIAVPDFWV